MLEQKGPLFYTQARQTGLTSNIKDLFFMVGRINTFLNEIINIFYCGLSVKCLPLGPRLVLFVGPNWEKQIARP